MWETPPYSLMEIRIKLSQYLDGETDAAEMAEMDALLVSFPDYQQELSRLRAVKNWVQGSCEPELHQSLHYNKISDQVWLNISSRLVSDLDSVPEKYDAEFISAYYDGEILKDTEECQAFESQLYANDEANHLLADIAQVSEMVRQLGYRMENACTLDISGDVMTRFLTQSDTASASLASMPDPLRASTVHLPVSDDILSESTPVSSDMLLLSAYADHELSAREIIQANQLIENEHFAKQGLLRFNQLSERIQSISQELQALALENFWLYLEGSLKQPVSQGGIIVPLRRASGFKEVLRAAAVPIAAAVALFVILIPPDRLNDGKSVSADAIRQSTQRISEKIPSQTSLTREIASVPVNSVNLADGIDSDSLESNALSGVRDSGSQIIPVSNRHSNSSGDMAALSQIAANAQSSSVNSLSGRHSNGHTGPSSEEYLFSALNEQMPDEDISNLLGK